ncbi:Histone acetylation protein 2 [Moelleriella libera RCEF 2490]|uniref:Elongator complex protein 5 n=1 Tax=Moelleriella libera RCEF 2490 TaxID=1081109 RepID=A0A167ZPC5_9HYPO|nr:Histone acetylation protein 2 [Moelleriella libera RCEF 2490]
MASASQTHARSHSLLLAQKLFNLRDAASPLTLLIDSLEQKAQPVVDEFINRAKISRTKVILLSFTTVRKPKDVDVLVRAAGRDLRLVTKELTAHYPKPDATPKPSQRAAAAAVVIIDSLSALASWAPSSLASFLSGLLAPGISLVGVYHSDVPVVLPKTFNEYEPHPFTMLTHLATAILRLSSLSQEIDRQRARDRAVQEPEWGLKEGREGVMVGLLPPSSRADDAHGGGGVVVEMELRRKSGRAVTETFVLLRRRADSKLGTGKLMLLTDHDVFRPVAGYEPALVGGGEPESTFDLGLTEKQRRDREGIVLPYFDAQTDIGAGEGGRILYEMGREDDFDDEEDEI